MNESNKINGFIKNSVEDSFFPNVDLREEIISYVNESINERISNLDYAQVSPILSKHDIIKIISKYDFNKDNHPQDVLNDVFDLLNNGIVHVTSPNYFGLFNPTSSFWGGIAEFITSIYNPQMAAWSHAPACVEIENKIINYFGITAGYRSEETNGIFTYGGSEANFTALICALVKKFPDYTNTGLSKIKGNPVFYVSSDSHLAWLKIAVQSGLGKSAVRLIMVDKNGKFDVKKLREAIEKDKVSGKKPFFVSATAGTTNAGIIDPLDDIADICKEYDLYYHVDAAWAGAILLSDTYKYLLKGIEHSDSITLDAHKWLAAPMGTGMFISSCPGILSQSFAVSTNYMPDKYEDNLDPYACSVQWSRKFNGLKLFIPMAILGHTGFRNMIEQQIDLGIYLKQRLIENRWEVINPSDLPIACFIDSDGHMTENILAAVLKENSHWLSMTHYAGVKTLRACITSFRTTKADIDKLISCLNKSREMT
ncbi:pyridoxal phosphate-dependent decarboxylase family protein [Xenorhabdus bharatensis]|uniref:pyridoxal phosphate-dependent decarboxylase family protein n=1 Tax=Xenorhabdus bharatensis TaxID=3136256 RepID=UPI0030F47B16